ncbi:hypothetical protein HELRODRAFT_169280 [Helobdella robusta]|uniref:Endonuclease/exonuclease/phosphatase domain-containing protein n=1 Tax=Helobdella robusta TaxID=6412 RepID=T1F1P9_HELRO|nr:hypothetical protein HELRODRAFT_169280 [Helobdella robusta]ESO08437.1 hypothetical protein HELRODRAFT_169280 [Helobdella robusta]
MSVEDNVSALKVLKSEFDNFKDEKWKKVCRKVMKLNNILDKCAIFASANMNKVPSLDKFVQINFKSIRKKLKEMLDIQQNDDNCKIKANKMFIKKSFFSMSNVQKSHRNNVIDYLKSIEINVISCYPVVKRADTSTTDNTSNDDTESTMFKVCIESCDAAKMKNPDLILQYIIRHYKDDLFHVLHINIRSLLNKSDDVYEFLQEINLEADILAITESWLNDDNENLINIDGYTFEGKHQTRKHGGGIGFYIKQNLHYKIRDDITNLNDEIEFSVVEILNKPAVKMF